MQRRIDTPMVALVFGIALMSVGPLRAEMTTAQLIDKVAGAERLVTSGAGTTIVHEQRFGNTSLGAITLPDEVRTTYKWAFAGGDLRQEVRRTTPPYTKDGKLVVESLTGTQSQRYVPDDKQMMVFGAASRGRVSLHPLWAQYIDLAAALDNNFQFLSAEITSASPTASGTGTVDGVDTVVLAGKSVLGQDVKWWIAPDYGYRVVKRETRWQLQDGGKETVVTDTYGAYAAVAEGVWLPSAVACTKTVGTPGGPHSVVLKITATTSFESVNEPVDASKLLIVPTVGTEITYVDDVRAKS